jgi:hypothetical protein
VTTTYFDASDQWVARRRGEPSVLDEDLGVAYLGRSGLGPEASLGIARVSTFIKPADKWFAPFGDGEDLENALVPVVDGVAVFHPGAPNGVQAQLAGEAPMSLGSDVLAGIHTEVLNWGEVARAVHPRLQHPPAAPSPFPYLPSTPQELLQAHLEIVGIQPADCFSTQATIDEPRVLHGRIAFGTSTIGSEQPSADGKMRRRIHGCRQVVIIYRDRPEYAEGRARWQAYQAEVLQAHLERATNVRRPVELDDQPDHGVLRAAAKAIDLVDKVVSVGEWQPPPPHRYCWPPLG